MALKIVSKPGGEVTTEHTPYTTLPIVVFDRVDWEETWKLTDADEREKLINLVNKETNK